MDDGGEGEGYTGCVCVCGAMHPYTAMRAHRVAHTACPTCLRVLDAGGETGANVISVELMGPNLVTSIVAFRCNCAPFRDWP